MSNADQVYEQVPIGGWAKDRQLKEIGRYGRAQMLEAVEPFTLALYTRVLGISIGETHVVMAGVRGELQNPRLHLYIPIHFVRGRKPDNG